jgi:hypothetical protein
VCLLIFVQKVCVFLFSFWQKVCVFLFVPYLFKKCVSSYFVLFR